MSDFTGIGQPTRILRKNAVYRQVADAGTVALPPAPVRAVAPTNPFTGTAASGPNYLQGINQWGEQVIIYIDPTATVINRSIG